MPAVPVSNVTRRFWIISSLLGIIVCGAMTLFWGSMYQWREAGMFSFFLICNVYTYRKYTRKSTQTLE